MSPHCALLLVLALLLAGSCSAQHQFGSTVGGCNTLKLVDFPLKNSTIQGNSTVDACCDLCNVTPRCQAFSFNKTNSTCFLKNFKPAARGNEVMISGARKTVEQGLQGGEMVEQGLQGVIMLPGEEDLSATGQNRRASTSRQRHSAWGAGVTVKQGLQGASKQAARHRSEGNNTLSLLGILLHPHVFLHLLCQVQEVHADVAQRAQQGARITRGEGLLQLMLQLMVLRAQLVYLARRLQAAGQRALALGILLGPLIVQLKHPRLLLGLTNVVQATSGTTKLIFDEISA
eukprot:jgi/Astpho2/9569/Aster-x1587